MLPVEAAMLECFQQYIKSNTQEPLEFVTRLSLPEDFAELTLLSRNKIDYTVPPVEDGSEKQLFASILITREVIQSYSDKVNDFKSFLQVCHTEKKKRDLAETKRVIVEFKDLVKKYILTNIEGDYTRIILPDDKKIIEVYLDDCHIPYSIEELITGLFRLTIPREAIHG